VPALRLPRTPALALFLSACAAGAPAPSLAPPRREPGFRCFVPPRIAPLLPDEIAPVLDQENVDCFAWQELVALGWPASQHEPGEPDADAPATRFGEPGDARRMVFQTYKDVADVFLPGAREPAPWSSRPAPPAACAADPAIARAVAEGAPVLDATDEAGVRAPAWLTAQSGKNVYFEIGVNRDVFEYVRREGLYDARRQLAAVQPGGRGIGLPSGQTAYGHEGAIEVKSAWLELDDARLAARYATTDAVLREPASGRCRLARMGLVGLHIVHKTEAAQQWTWATFEHEDNAPDHLEVERGALASAYTFYPSSCAPASAPACQPNRKPECAIGACDPRSQPVAVVREVSIAPEVQRLNEAMSRLIAEANPRSVWRHYRLVDVMWPASGEVVPPGREAPLTHGGAQPPALANTTMETYVQTGDARKNCLDCHAQASVAPTAPTSAALTPAWASDYSFIFQRACDPSAPAGVCHPRIAASAALPIAASGDESR
jgi:hypothetical protein